MLNILSYIGVSLQSELCLWTMLGLLRTIFDATLFKVNANLKQVWQMTLPSELSMPVQRGLRTMISGVMLVQCFTVYVYLAAYIVLLYPVFLEERPTLALPWLLLAAIRRFLCELTSLTLGLAACVLLGPVRTPCIKFVAFKVASITPAVYMWMLVFSYYNTLKLSLAFKSFPATVSADDQDHGIELAVRRRRTKSLQDEVQLRKRLVASLNYGETSACTSLTSDTELKSEITARMAHSTHADFEDIKAEMLELNPVTPLPIPTERATYDFGAIEDWCGSELILPRDTDRILEQFAIMMLRIGAYIKAEGNDPAKLLNSPSRNDELYKNLECSTIQGEDAETPLQVGNTTGKTVYSYLEEYPQIFMKKPETKQLQGDQTSNTNQIKQNDNTNSNQSETTNNLSKTNVENINSEHAASYSKNSTETKRNLESQENPLLANGTKLLNLSTDSNIGTKDDKTNLQQSQPKKKDSNQIRRPSSQHKTKSPVTKTEIQASTANKKKNMERTSKTDIALSQAAQALTPCSLKTANITSPSNNAAQTNFNSEESKYDATFDKQTQIYHEVSNTIKPEIKHPTEVHISDITPDSTTQKRTDTSESMSTIQQLHFRGDESSDIRMNLSDIKIEIEKQISQLEGYVQNIMYKESESTSNTQQSLNKENNLDNEVRATINEPEPILARRSQSDTNHISTDENNYGADYPITSRSLKENNPLISSTQDLHSNSIVSFRRI